MHPRLQRELKTLAAMTGLYCRGVHGSKALCPQCRELLDYGRARLQKCPYGGDKPTCAKCPVHCYRPDMRERVRAVMRYSGPRMLSRHPLLALRHMLDGRKPPPPRGAPPADGGQQV